jgi:hypothetical protein
VCSGFQKLSELAHRADAAVLASVCWSVEGDAVRAGALLEEAQRRTRLSSSELRAWVERLKATMRGTGGT